MINNNLQAYHLVKKIAGGFEIGKLESLVPQYLRSGIEIFSHQIYASTFALSNPFVKGFILADEAGLGKTMEALLILAQCKNSKNCILVVVPSPTIDSWLTSIIRIFNFRCVVLDNKERPVSDNYAQSLRNFYSGIVLTTYDYLTANTDVFKEFDWQLCILDEAHRFRTYKIKENKTAEIVLSVTPNAKKILLTATPIQKNEDDIFGLINFIDDNIFTDYDEFHKRYFRKPENYPELRDIIAPYTFRTLRSQVKVETKLPDRQILTQIYKMTDKEKNLYSLLEKYIAKPTKQAFPEMNPYELSLMLYGTLSSSAYALSKTLSGIYVRLNKNAKEENLEERKEIKEMLDLATSIRMNNKDEMLLNALKQTFSTFHKKGIAKKCVIFTSNTQSQEHIHKILMQNTDYSINSFNGTTDDEPIKKFLTSEKPAILISTDKGNESLNWQASSFVINYDFPQVLLDMEQRISRCHRIGQATDVFVLNFICPDNFSDVRMYELFYKRMNISNSIIGASDTIISGAVDGDIESNIRDTLDNVRKKKEVQIEFSELSEEFRQELDAIKADSNDVLFNTFDRHIVEKTKNMAEIIKRKVAELDGIIKELARFYYKDSFIDENTFECKTDWHRKNLYAEPFKFSLVGDERFRAFTLGSDPCQSMLSDLAMSYRLKPLKLILNGNGKFSGFKGYVASFNLSVYFGFNSASKYCLIGIDENRKVLDNDICNELLDLECIENKPTDIPNEIKEKLKKEIELIIPKLQEPLKEEIDKSATLPLSHIKMLAENEKSKLEKEIKILERGIENVKNNSASDNFGEGLAKNQKINELTEKLFELKDNEFLKKSKINKETKQKIEEFLQKNELKSQIFDNFMLYFEVR